MLFSCLREALIELMSVISIILIDRLMFQVLMVLRESHENTRL